ncbi:MAG TPA: SMC-Scp complex subunit ScpB [Pyrinomonadaceae bacterium]|jgi:segregation and condensation protein B|nr:SMC-Scp complex subunit ScpB [Pyrinomonadaceae bacterium]
MSKSSSKKNGQEETAPSALTGAGSADVEERESAVEELDDALDALPGGGDADSDSDDESNANPLAQVDVSGETSFESAEFEAEDEASSDEDAEDEDDTEELPDDEDDSDDDEEEDEPDFVVHDADAEDRAEQLERMRAAVSAQPAPAQPDDDIAPGGQPRELAELVNICEALIFVSEEPIAIKALADILGEDKGWVQVAVEELAKEFNERTGGLMLREVAGGWQFATRPEHHEHIRAYLKSKPSAKLSLAALETLAVIAYKQPVTVPEILEIRGVQSSSAIKTLLDKRLIIAKGRKETVGRPMMYGTSKDFLLQFGLRDLSELPNVEDFEDLAGGGEI